MALATALDLHVPVFAGQSTLAFDTIQVREQALRDASIPAGAVLLSTCHESFITELSNMSFNDFEEVAIDLADFPKPSSLLTLPSICYRHNQVISDSTLFLFQALRYLSFIHRVGETTGSCTPCSDVLRRNAENGAGVLGLSSGMLLAVIVGTSLNTSTFISKAVEAYRLSLCIGIRTQIYRQKVLSTVPPTYDPSLPWGIEVMSLTRGVVEDLIHAFHKQVGDSILFITVTTDASCTTVSGRPDYLAAFSASLSSSAVIHRTNLDTLYHAPVLTKPVRDRILSDVATRNIRFPTLSDIQIPIRSTFTGDAITHSTVTSGALTELVIGMVIVQPADWRRVVERLVEAVPVITPAKLLNCSSDAGLIGGVHRAFSRDNVSILDLYPTDPNPKGVLKQGPVAIVGVAVNVPGAPNAEKMRKVLAAGISTISEIPQRRSDISDLTARNKPERFMGVHTGSFVENVDEFDNEFFKISPRDVGSMDPQQRILLHVAYEVLEDAGYIPYSPSTWNPEAFGCYVGVATHDYQQNLRNEIDVHYTGTLKAFSSGRVSYAMKFSGPSVVVDTACSSSVVVLYQIVRALSDGDYNAALVGGVNIISGSDMFLGLDRGHSLNPTGKSKAFDASADGYSRSEGIGVFILERRSNAVFERDNILGVIRAIEANQNGLAHPITCTHVSTQTKFFRRILEIWGLDARPINVVEAGRTGTHTNDTSKLESIRNGFGRDQPANNPLHITSIKSSIGHLRTASGTIGLAELLVLRHKNIFPAISSKHLHPNKVNSASDCTSIDVTRAAWVPTKKSRPRAAFLNSFGKVRSVTAMVEGGYLTPLKQHIPQKLYYIFGISAKDPKALEVLRAGITKWIRDPKHSPQSLSNMMYMPTARHHLYDHRLAVPASTKRGLAELGEATVIQVENWAADQRAMPLEPPSELPTIDYKMLARWLQYPSKDNGFVAIFKTPIQDLAGFIRGHSVGGIPLCPASVYLEQAYTGIQLAWHHLSVSSSTSHAVLRNIKFAKPLVYNENVGRTIMTNVTVREGAGTFSVISIVDGSAQESLHMCGEYRIETTSNSSIKLRRLLPLVDRRISSTAKAKDGGAPQTFSTRTIYEMIFPRVVDYAKDYHTMRSLTVDPTEMEGFASVKLPHSYDRGKFVIHPIFTDTLLHVAGFVANLRGGINDAYICSGVGSVRAIPSQVENDVPYTVYCRNNWLADEGIVLAEAYAVKLTEPPLLIAHLKNIHFRKVRLNSLKRVLAHAAKAIPSQQPRPTPPAPPGTPLVSTRVQATGPLPKVFPPFARITNNIPLDSKLPNINTSTAQLIKETAPRTPTFSPATNALDSQSQASSPRTLVPEGDFPDPVPFEVESKIDIKRILGNVLDVNPKNIGDDISFEILGLDSLTSIEAVTALSSELGVDLPENFFNIYPTTRKVQEYLFSHLPRSKSGATPQEMPRDMAVDQVAPCQVEESPKSEFSVTVSQATVVRLTRALRLDTTPLSLQKSESKAPPLFLIHDGSGLISYYAGVSSLGRQVWGFNNPHFATSKPWSSIIEMASSYAGYISKITTGPIILGGWSFGGVAAYEISLQLAKKGIETQGVLLIDSPSPINHVPLSDSLINSVVNLDARSANSDLGRLVKAQFAMNARMLGEYNPRVTGGICPPLVLLRSSEGFNPPGVSDVPVWLADRSDPKIATAGWEALAPGPVEVLDIPGNHFTPFYPTNIKSISERMTQACAFLEKA